MKLPKDLDSILKETERKLAHKRKQLSKPKLSPRRDVKPDTKRGGRNSGNGGETQST